MGAPDLTLSPGDIVRGLVDHVDASLDACFLDAGAHGMLLVPLAGLPGTTVARLLPKTCVCAQVVAPQRGKRHARATTRIEFSGRTSVLVLDGVALMGDEPPAQVTALVSADVPGVRRAELATQLEAAFSDASTGLPSMLGAVCGPVDVVLRSAADDAPWAQVLSSVVVQMTEAAAFTVLARADSAPALLMAEKPDADGDASIGRAGRYSGPDDMLDGRRLVLSCGASVLFERTEAMWSVSVSGEGQPVGAANAEAAAAVGEAVAEYDVAGLVVVAFLPGMSVGDFTDLLDVLSEALGVDGTRISGDAAFSVALIARERRTLH